MKNLFFLILFVTSINLFAQDKIVLQTQKKQSDIIYIESKPKSKIDKRENRINSVALSMRKDFVKIDNTKEIPYIKREKSDSIQTTLKKSNKI